MNNQIVTIKHVSGVYKLIVAEKKIEETRNAILQCLANDSEFTSKDQKGRELIFPSEFLRNSQITIEIEESFDVSLEVESN